MNTEKMEVFSESDVLTARDKAREAARRLGFSMADQTRIALCVSELASNILLYGEAGYIEFRELETPSSGRGVEIKAVDYGPGNFNVDLALTAGYSTSGGLGMGLPGVKSMMDDMKIEMKPGQGTVITVYKWLNNLETNWDDKSAPGQNS